ncbi:hypothetical protein V1514DRAFT_331704 [Lipomyces japonicus]|uniref:uncharacterized protein n=1 Tax=Lipomyces japonicus TaxID=56871 RepID=UPI0034CF6FA6
MDLKSIVSDLPHETERRASEPVLYSSRFSADHSLFPSSISSPTSPSQPSLHGKRSMSVPDHGRSSSRLTSVDAKINTHTTKSPGSNRRFAHILSEQRRRENINGGFLELKDAIPQCRGAQDSKAAILRKAVIYIASLESEVRRLKTSQQSQFSPQPLNHPPPAIYVHSPVQVLPIPPNTPASLTNPYPSQYYSQPNAQPHLHAHAHAHAHAYAYPNNHPNHHPNHPNHHSHVLKHYVSISPTQHWPLPNSA